MDMTFPRAKRARFALFDDTPALAGPGAVGPHEIPLEPLFTTGLTRLERRSGRPVLSGHVRVRAETWFVAESRS